MMGSYALYVQTKLDREEEKVASLQAKVDHLESLLDSFWTGDVPQGASLDHMKLAKYGRLRLAEIGKTPALLVK